MRAFLAFGAVLPLAALGCAASSGPSGAIDQRDFVRVGTGSREYVLDRYVGPEVSTVRLPASATDVWRVLPDVYREATIPVGASDPELRILGTSNHRISGRFAGQRLSIYFDCGRAGGLGAPAADTGPVTISVFSEVTPRGAADSDLRTIVSGTAPGGAGVGGSRECTSTGVLERLLAAIAAVRLGASGEG